MILPSLLAASTLALQAAAQLVPLELHPDTESNSNANALLDTFSDFGLFRPSKAKSVALDCPGCLFDMVNDHQGDHPRDSHNSLMLDFTIDEENTLQLNGKTIYPVEFPLTAELYAPLARSDDEARSPPLRLSYMIEYLEQTSINEDVNIPIEVGILEMQGLPVYVDKVAVRLVRENGQLGILNIDRVPFNNRPSRQCMSTICRARESILASLRKMVEDARARAAKVGERVGMKGCGGRMRKHQRPSHVPGHHRLSHHGQHGHHRHHTGFHKMVHRATHLFIIPALLGIIGGLTASAIGMIVGQTIVFLWFRFVRGGQRGRVSSARTTEIGLEEEKESLVEDEEALPPYEDSDEVAEDKN